MEDVIVGLLAVAVGALFCLRGYLAMRLVIPVWGALAGLVFGAGLASAITDDEVLGTALGWVLAVLFAGIFGVLAYLYYQVAVVLTLASVGFSIGTGVMVALGIEWNWLIVVVGLGVGVILGLVALFGDLPMLLLVAFSAVAGAVIVVAGAMLVFNTVDLDQMNDGRTTDLIKDSWFWYVTYLAVVVASMVVQIQSMESLRGGLRQAWEGTPVTPKQMGPPGAAA
jgi:hypothetical protein